MRRKVQLKEALRLSFHATRPVKLEPILAVMLEDTDWAAPWLKDVHGHNLELDTR